MNRYFYIIFLMVTLDSAGSESPPFTLIPIGRSKTAPLRFPRDNAEAEKEIADAIQLNDDMQLIAARKSKTKVVRSITPETMKLLRLDPNLGHTINENIQKLNCQTTILEGIQAFDDAQGAYLELDATPKTFVDDHKRYEDFTAIEVRQLEALCIFVSAYEKGCLDAYPYITSSHHAIMNLETKRKLLNPNIIGMHPNYNEKEFLKRIKTINIQEDGRKSDNRKSLSLPPPNQTPSLDLNKAGDLRTRAMQSLQIADTLVKRVLNAPTPDITKLEYQQVEALYCKGMKIAIKSFHIQPQYEEKQILFEEVLANLRKVQELQSRQQKLGFSLEISDEYVAICKFIEDNRSQYELPLSEKGKITWNRAVEETKDRALPAPLSHHSEEPAAPTKSRLERFLECIMPCVKK